MTWDIRTIPSFIGHVWPKHETNCTCSHWHFSAATRKLTFPIISMHKTKKLTMFWKHFNGKRSSNQKWTQQNLFAQRKLKQSYYHRICLQSSTVSGLTVGRSMTTETQDETTNSHAFIFSRPTGVKSACIQTDNVLNLCVLVDIACSKTGHSDR